MAIYKFSDFSEKKEAEKSFKPEAENPKPESEPSLKDRFLSSSGARLFFLFLLVVDMIWGAFSIAMIALYFILNISFGFSSPFLKRKLARSYLSLRRSLVCGVALLVAVFSPALGIMFACSYFLMYDKQGIEEVVPASLQDQFKEFYAN